MSTILQAVSVQDGFQNFSWFFNKKVAWFCCDEDVVLCVLFQHDLFGNPKNIVDDIMMYVWSMTCARLYDTAFDIHISCGVYLCASIATSWECHWATSRFAMRVMRFKRSMFRVPNRVCTARCRAASELKWTLGLLIRRCRKIDSSKSSGSLVAGHSCSTFLSLLQLIQVRGVIDAWMWTTPGLELRRQLAASMLEKEMLFEIRSS